MALIKRYTWLLVTVFIATAVYVGWSNRYDIYDWAALRSYTPPAEIVRLADSSGMNDYGRRLFYVHSPEIADKNTFNSSCTHTEKTIVLGCYTGTDIYIYDVQKDELAGIKEVTAAHEMLHAAYDRLSGKERNRVDALTAEYYKKINNPRINSLVESYKSQDPSIVPNELHSIMGTEIEKLPSELEVYYSRYFDDRQKVVTFSKAYEAVFDAKRNQIERMKGDLGLRKIEIEKIEAEINAKEAELTSLKQQMTAYINQDNTSSYNLLVPTYNALVNEYNVLVARVQARIAEYNNLVQEHNNLVVGQQELINSIDSQYQPTE